MTSEIWHGIACLLILSCAALGLTQEGRLIFKPVLTLDLSDVTVEAVLTAIAKRYGGDCCWTVEYYSEANRFEDSLLTFFVPKGIRVSAGPRSN